MEAALLSDSMEAISIGENKLATTATTTNVKEADR